MQLMTFNFDGASVRTTRDEKGEPWFVAADVCAVLEIGNVSMALARLDDDERGISSTDTLGGMQRMVTINESGLYSLVLGSRKPEAKTFKKWITAEVLPSIRKTGAYGHADPMAVLNDPAAMRGLLLGYSEKVLALESTVAAQSLKVAALDRIATADVGSKCITDAAKHLQLQPKRLFTWLQENQWIYKRLGTSWLAYQHRLQTGTLEHKVTTVSRTDGSEKMVSQVLVTPKGLAKLAEIFATADAVA